MARNIPNAKEKDKICKAQKCKDNRKKYKNKHAFLNVATNVFQCKSLLKENKIGHTSSCTNSCLCAFSNESLSRDSKVKVLNDEESSKCSKLSEHSNEHEFFYFTMNDFDALCLELDLQKRRKGTKEKLKLSNPTESRKKEQRLSHDLRQKVSCDPFMQNRICAENSRVCSLPRADSEECVILKETKPNHANKKNFNSSAQENSNKNFPSSEKKVKFDTSDKNTEAKTKEKRRKYSKNSVSDLIIDKTLFSQDLISEDRIADHFLSWESTNHNKKIMQNCHQSDAEISVTNVSQENSSCVASQKRKNIVKKRKPKSSSNKLNLRAHKKETGSSGLFEDKYIYDEDTNYKAGKLQTSSKVFEPLDIIENDKNISKITSDTVPFRLGNSSVVILSAKTNEHLKKIRQFSRKNSSLRELSEYSGLGGDDVICCNETASDFSNLDSRCGLKNHHVKSAKKEPSHELRSSDETVNVVNTYSCSESDVQERSAKKCGTQKYQNDCVHFSTLQENNGELSIVWDAGARNDMFTKTNKQLRDNSRKKKSVILATVEKNSIGNYFTANCMKENQKSNRKVNAEVEQDGRDNNSLKNPVLNDDVVFLQEIRKEKNNRKKGTSAKSVKNKNIRFSYESFCLPIRELKKDSFVADKVLSSIKEVPINYSKSVDGITSDSINIDHQCETNLIQTSKPNSLTCSIAKCRYDAKANMNVNKHGTLINEAGYFSPDVSPENLTHVVNDSNDESVNFPTLTEQEYLAQSKHHISAKKGKVHPGNFSKITIAVDNAYQTDAHHNILNLKVSPNKDMGKNIPVQDNCKSCLAPLNKKFDPYETFIVLDDSDLVPEPLDFELPPLHRTETISRLTDNQKIVLQAEGITIKFGKWTKKEESILLNNYEEFTKRFGINDPCYLLGIGRERKDARILEFLRAKHFLARLGKNLNDRPLKDIYSRARRLLHPLRKSEKWSKSEILSLLQLRRSLGNKWGKISRIIGRTPDSCIITYNAHEKNFRKGKWTLEEEDLLIAAIKSTCGMSDISPKSIANIPWKEIAKLVPSRNHVQCYRRAVSLSFRAFRGLPKEKWNKECRKKLIHVLKAEWWVEDERMINWKKVYESFEDVAPSYLFLNKVWHNLKYSVPSVHKKSFRDIIKYLYERYFGKSSEM